MREADLTWEAKTHNAVEDIVRHQIPRHILQDINWQDRQLQSLES